MYSLEFGSEDHIKQAYNHTMYITAERMSKLRQMVHQILHYIKQMIAKSRYGTSLIEIFPAFCPELKFLFIWLWFDVKDQNLNIRRAYYKVENTRDLPRNWKAISKGRKFAIFFRAFYREKAIVFLPTSIALKVKVTYK